MSARLINSRGFTLIELSIVLVVIGLIIGGILVGRDLIKAAEIRATISQIEKLRTAVNTFKLKYNALPGDMMPEQASDLGFNQQTYAVPATFGNGMIDGNAVSSEWTNFFAHLREAQLLQCICQPPVPFNNISAVTDLSLGTWGTKISGASFFVYGGAAYFGGIIVAGYTVYNQNYLEIDPTSGSGQFSLTPQEAYSIDVKMDDGLPLTGRVVDIGTSSYFALIDYLSARPANVGVAGGDFCTSNSLTPNVYNVLNDKKLCNLRMNADF